jgi:aminocarboxymuconate-semialdehyde decarboxylase
MSISQSILIDCCAAAIVSKELAGGRMKIDVHAHFVNAEFYDELTRLPGIFVRDTGDGRHELRLGNTTYMWRKEEWFRPDHCLSDMDRKGIDMRLLSFSAPNVHSFPTDRQPALARSLNDALLRKCDTAPDRLRALCCLPLADIEEAFKELDRVRGSAMFAGVSMGSSLDAVPLNHPRLEPIWARFDQLRIPVVEHPMYPANTSGLDEYELPIRLGFIYETTTALTRMIYGGVFERYPNFPYVVAHTGGALLVLLERLDNGYRIFPDCRQHISKLPSHYAQQLYYDTCSFSAEAILLAHRLIGADRLLFGTDYPYIDTGSDHVTTLPIPTKERSAILGANAVRLFGLAPRNLRLEEAAK